MEETREGLVGLLPEDMITLVCRIFFRFSQRIGVGFRCSSELSLASINPSGGIISARLAINDVLYIARRAVFHPELVVF